MTSRDDKEFRRWQRNLDKAVRAAYPSLAGPAPKRKRLKRHPDADPGFLRLGYDAERNGIVLTTAQRLQHMQMIGMTRAGKTKDLEYIIRQDLIKDHGFIAMDPHGGHRDSLFNEVLCYIQKHRPRLLKNGKVFILSPNARGQVVGFNPLARLPGVALSVIADTLLSAFEQVWGGEDTHQKPTIRTVLKATFIALAERGMNLTDAKLFYDPEDRHGVRARVLEQLQNEFARDELARIDRLAQDPRLRREFEMSVLGPINRLNDFVSSDALSRLFGMNAGFEPSPAKAIDILDIMEKGHILLVDLQPARELSEADTKLLGTIFLRYTNFLSRLRTHYKPFFVHVDECHLYMTNDIPEMMPQLAKYGVGITLAHQYLSQLGTEGEKIYDAVRKSTLTKVIFRMVDQKEAETVAYSAMPIDLKEPKEMRPTVVGDELVRLEGGGNTSGNASSKTITQSKTRARARTVAESSNWSETESSGEADMIGQSLAKGLTTGSGFGASTTGGHSDAMSLQYDPATGSVLSVPMPIGQGITSVDSSSLGSFDTSSLSESELESINSGHVTTSGYAATLGGGITRGESEAEGEGIAASEGESSSYAVNANWHQGYKAVWEDRPQSYYTKDEQLYRNGLLIRSLETGHAYVSIGSECKLMAVPKLESMIPKGKPPPLHESVASTPAAQSLADADAHIAARRKALGVGEGKPTPDDSQAGQPEPLPAAIIDHGDPPPPPEPKGKGRSKPDRPPRSYPPTPKKKPEGPNLTLVVSDVSDKGKTPPEDAVE